MDETKKRKLNARLKELIAESEMAEAASEAPQASHQPHQQSSAPNVSVIRRRRGKPDHQIKS